MTVRQMKRWPRPEQTGEVYICYPLGTMLDETHDALVLTCAGTLDEARLDARLQGGASIFVCDYHVDERSGDYADNERFVEDAK